MAFADGPSPPYLMDGRTRSAVVPKHLSSSSPTRLDVASGFKYTARPKATTDLPLSPPMITLAVDSSKHSDLGAPYGMKALLEVERSGKAR